MMRSGDLIDGVTKIDWLINNAIKSVARGNSNTDNGKGYLLGEAHFTDELLVEGQARLQQKTALIRTYINRRNYGAAQETLGEALHGIQDFYSHSNWVEMNRGSLRLNDVLGFPNRRFDLNTLAGKDEATCADCDKCRNCDNNVIKYKLTSAYFGLYPGASKPSGKCSHSAKPRRVIIPTVIPFSVLVNFDFTENQPAKGGINKDTLDCQESPHSDLHMEAAGFAYAATRRYIKEVIKEMLTPVELRNLFNVRRSRAFAVDTTNSMNTKLATVKQQIIKQVDDRIAAGQESSYVLVSINDPNVQVVSATDDAAEFKRKVGELSATGGGEPAEPLMRGALTAVNAMDAGGELTIFTDASAKDNALATEVYRAAEDKEIEINTVAFGGDTANGGELLFCFENGLPGVIDPATGKCHLNYMKRQKLNEKGTSAQTASHGKGGASFVSARFNTTRSRRTLANDWSRDTKATQITPPQATPTIDPQLERLSRETGGQAFALLPEEANRVSELLDQTAQADKVTLLSVSDTLAGTRKDYTVPIDSTVTNLTFSVSGTNNLTVKRPDGTSVTQTGDGVSKTTVTGASVYTIASPATGAWSISVTGTGKFSLKVSGDSSLYASSFKYMEFGGGAGHEGYFPITGSPLAGQRSMASGELLTNDARTAQFEFRAPDGRIIQRIDLKEIPRPTDLPSEFPSNSLYKEFFGEVITPGEPFAVYVTGLNTRDQPYQRLVRGAFTPQTIKVTADPIGELHPGETTAYSFQVQNFGAAGEFRVAAKDSQNFVRSVSPSSISLDAGESKSVNVQLSVPSDAVEDDIDRLTLTAQSATNSESNNYAIIEAKVAAASSLKLGAIAATAIEQDGDGVVEPGEGASLNVQLTNGGDTGAKNVTATLATFTPGVTITSGVSGYAEIAPSGAGVNSKPFSFYLNEDAPCGQTINFTLLVRYDGQDAPALYNFVVPRGCTAAAVRRQADLSVASTMSSVSVESGAYLNQTIIVTNNGTISASGVTVASNLPNGATLSACVPDNNGTCGISGNIVSARFDAIPAGTSATVTINTTVGCSVPDATLLNYPVHVSSATPDPNADNNVASSTTRVVNRSPIIVGAAADKSELFPPNHKMIDVRVNYSTEDDCGTPTNILTVTSNKPINGTGDGDTSPDWEVLDAHRVRLRAERSGGGAGRSYYITIKSVDGAGGASTQTLTVRVPKSRK